MPNVNLDGIIRNVSNSTKPLARSFGCALHVRLCPLKNAASDTKDLDLKYDKVAETGSWRVQRTRAIHRAWNQHAWPDVQPDLSQR